MDKELLVALNSFLLSTDQKFVFVSFMGNNPVPRGFPIFFCLVALWFSADSDQRRSRILIGLLATSFATIASVSLQRHFTPHIRPFLDPTLHLKIFDPHLTEVWDRMGSFPSDTATLFFALGTIILIENRLLGVLCLVWAMMTAGLARVALGYHYPSDIMGALVLGPATVCLFENIPYLRALVERCLSLFHARAYIVHALLFLFLAEAENLFLGFQGILKYLKYLSGITTLPGPPLVY